MFKSQTGFTLIELMLVLVLIALLAGMFALNLSPSPQQQIDREARRLQWVLQQAAEQSVTQGVELALSLPSNGYQIIQFSIQERQWVGLEDKLFRSYTLADGLHLKVLIDREQWSAEEQQQLALLIKNNPLKLSPPIIVFLSSGETTPFKLMLFSNDTDYVVTLIGDGFSAIERLQ